MGNDKIVFFGAGILASALIHTFCTRIGMNEVIEDMRYVGSNALGRVESDVSVWHAAMSAFK